MSNTVKNRVKSKKNQINQNNGNSNEKDIKFQRSCSTNQSLLTKVLTRTVVIFSLLIVVYFTNNEEKVKTYAKHTDSLTIKGQVVECSEDYMKEMHKYEECFPKKCGRFVSDKVVTEKEADELLLAAKKGLKLGGSFGGASILDFHSGALSKGEKFVNIYKIKEAQNLFTDADFQLYKTIKEKIKFSVAHNFGVLPEKIFLTHPTFFSEITSREAVTIHDEYWHPHVDKDTYKSFHYTTLLYLNEYDVDFNGGRFIFIDGKYNTTIEPKKARLSMFTSGAENMHHVEKVTSGVRYAVTISFTCDKKYAISEPTTSNKYL